MDGYEVVLFKLNAAHLNGARGKVSGALKDGRYTVELSGESCVGPSEAVAAHPRGLRVRPRNLQLVVQCPGQLDAVERACRQLQNVEDQICIMRGVHAARQQQQLQLQQHLSKKKQKQQKQQRGLVHIAAMNLAGLLRAADREGDCEEALHILRALPPCSDLEDTLFTEKEVAATLTALGDTGAALPLLRRAFERARDSCGADHDLTLSIAGELAGCLGIRGQCEEAIALRRSSVDAMLASPSLGAQHPATLTQMHNLACMLQETGRYEALVEALPLLRLVAAERERKYGPRHERVFKAKSSLAACLSGMSRFTDALPLHRAAVQGLTELLGADHPLTINAQNALAVALLQMGRNEEAVPILQRARAEVTRDRTGIDATLASNLADAFSGMGRGSDAVELQQQAVEQSLRVLGPEHPRSQKFLKTLVSRVREEAAGGGEAAHK